MTGPTETMTMADPAPVIMDVPPEEAIEFFRAKGIHVGYDWRDTSAAQHARSFTVAKVARLDILTDIRAAMDRVLAEGATFESFQDELEPILRAKGWWGRKTMTDPATGKTRVVRMGSPRRLRTIFDTNLRMATAAGKWAQITRLADRRPWIRYIATLDDRTRPLHRVWHGTILRWDHPFWQTHFPPCGWHCRCTVQTLSDADLERFGLTPSPGPPEGWNRTRPWLNRRTGETEEVPVGIDPGFAHNPGTVDPVAGARDILKDRLAKAPPALARAATSDVTEWIARGRERRKQLVDATGLAPDQTGFTDRLRGLAARGLTTGRGAGTVAASVTPLRAGGQDRAAADAIHAASLRFPANWVARANASPLSVAAGGQPTGGSYIPAAARGPVRIGPDRLTKADNTAWAITSRDPGNATHEYAHHLQAAMPEIDRLFQTLHIRRTTLPGGNREPRILLSPYRVPGRRDQYVDEYFGREYPGGHAAEVMTRAFQILFHRLPGRRGVDLDKLVRDDPEMLDLVLGLLFHYDPR